DAPPGPTVVSGVDVDPHWDAATASAGGGPHRASTAGLVAPDVLVVEVETGRIVFGAQEDYTFSAPANGDQISDGDDGRKVVFRNGAISGSQDAAGADLLQRVDTVLAWTIDTGKLDRAGGYRIAAGDDDASGGGGAPVAVTRST